MYGKIFECIYDGTLVDDWRALITFQQLIILCDPDGIVDMTPRAISRRTGIPIEHIEAGLKVLEDPDPYSRTEGEEGRRIVLIDDHRPWGWKIVNHEKYKNFRTAQDRRQYMREYVKDYRKQKSLQEFTEANSKQELAPLANTDTDTNTDTDKKNKGRFTPPSFDEVTDYCRQRNNDVDPQGFIDFYESKGWMIGKNKMKDWKAAVRTWEKRNETNKRNGKPDTRTALERFEATLPDDMG